MSSPLRPWVVIPTYNEAATIATVISATHAALRQTAPDFQLLIVDDTSPDGTGRVVAELQHEHPELHLLSRHQRAGLGAAYLAGFAYALHHGASHVCEMDADLSHDPADLPRLLSATQDDCDLALGSRYAPGGSVTDWGLARRLLSHGGSRYARTVLGLDIADLTGGYKCFRREVLEGIDLPSVRARGYAFQVELSYRAVRAGYRVCEIPIRFQDRHAGQSKMNWRIAAEAAWLIPQLRRAPHPTRASTTTCGRDA